MDFQGADLRAVLGTLAEISGLNIVIDPQVTGSVDVRLFDVPLDQALDVILRANKLRHAVDGTILRIAPVKVLDAQQKDRIAPAKMEAPPAMNVSDITVTGVAQIGGAYLAMVQGPSGKTYIVYPGDRLRDGTIRSITPQGLVMVHEINDPQSLARQREVRKVLRSFEEAK